jgi:putative ABC transport system permease protein
MDFRLPAEFDFPRGTSIWLSLSATVSPDAVIVEVRTLDDLATSSIAEPRLRAGLVTAFSAVALLPGMFGIYGVMTYTVAQRAREIGIRMALGARAADVGWMVLGQALHLTAVGIALGLVASFVVTRGISSVFFGVGPADVTTLTATSLLLMVAALLASVWPARRAIRIDPAVVLRRD